ncbi:MAG: ABC transporter ATP-binding protein, partial [Candidatus Aeolococcus gillhamiae]
GTLDEILGGGTAVRLRVTGLDGLSALLSRWGDVAADGEWFTVAGVDSDGVADIVAALVAHGARVHAVEPQRLSLEDRFLEVLRAADEGAAA